MCSERICAIDVGSKNLKLVIGEHIDGAVVARLVSKATLDLGAEVRRKQGLIGPEKLTELRQVLQRFEQSCDSLGADRILAVATSAIRNTANQGEVAALIRGLGIDLDIADGLREAVIDYLAATRGASHKIVSDLGSLSCQIAWQAHGRIQAMSLEKGYETLYRDFIEPAAGFAEAQTRYRAYLDTQVPGLPADTDQYIALASKSMAGFVLGRDKDEVSDDTLSRMALTDKFRELSESPPARFRALLSGLDKASKVLPGMILVDYVMERCAHDEVLIAEAELPIGLIVEYFQSHGK
jgi:exopolyphosphatase/guanosine-5'-triphosphate,3'-diphosphate pyrophosphatase